MTKDNTASLPRISAAGLKVPPPPPSSPTVDPQPITDAAAGTRDWTEAEREALISDLHELQTYCRSNKLDEAMILIDECIDRGADTIGHIISMLEPLGYGRGQIGSMLTKGKRPYWKANAEGRYARTANHPLIAAVTKTVTANH